MADRPNCVGQHIGEYHLLRRLGGGGFGDVYLGEHKHIHTQAAVKVLHTSLAGSNEFKEFINEARTFRLRHPHIIQLLDFGIDRDEIPYLVMDYASHGTLRDKHPTNTLKEHRYRSLPCSPTLHRSLPHCSMPTSSISSIEM